MILDLEVLTLVEKEYSEASSITPDLLAGFNTALLGAQSAVPLGIRTIQNWIGGSQWTTVTAEFVPPPPEEVPRLLEDLCCYINGDYHGALIQGALVHAQCESIHPFANGNGRVGRALIHGTLQRRGLTEHTILPISLVLGTWSQRYTGGLTAFRQGNIQAWLEIFF